MCRGFDEIGISFDSNYVEPSRQERRRVFAGMHAYVNNEIVSIPHGRQNGI